MNATTTSSIFDDLKLEEKAEWLPPTLQLVSKASGLGNDRVSSGIEATSRQVFFVSGTMTLSF